METAVAELSIISVVAFLLAAFFVAYAIRTISDISSYVHQVQSRLVYGVPWGTLTITVGVIAVYVGLQGGHTDSGPVVVGYRSWSFAYPDALAISSFAHFDTQHVLGNLTWFLVFGSLAEYAWGHYPSSTTTNSSQNVLPRNVSGWTETPGVRVGAFITAVVGYGVVSSMVTPGATIGASGIVFAVCGAVILLAPKLAVLGVVTVEPVRVIVTAVTNPVYTTTQQSGIALDVSLTSHMFGLAAGFLIAYVLLHYRDEWHESLSPEHVAFALLVFAATTNLYAFTQPVSQNTNLVLHGIGAMFMLVLVVIGTIMSVRERVVVSSRIDLSAQEVAVGSVLCIILAFSLVGLVYNVVPVTSDAPDASIEVEEYTVMYGEEVDDAYATSFSTASVVDPPKQSGVIITSNERNVWHVAVSAAELRNEKRVTIPVGGVGWSEDATVDREEWRLPAQQPVYTVTTDHTTEETVLYESDPVTSAHRVDGNWVTIGVEDGEFLMTVRSSTGGTETAHIPEEGESQTVGEITFERQGNALYATSGDTRTHIASHRAPT